MVLPIRAARAPLAAACAIGLSALAGCQAYAPRPLNPAEHRAEFLARSPRAEAVAEFARRLDHAKPAPPVFNPEDGISAEEAEIIALVFNADLRRARARAGVAAATAEFAGLWEDPVLGTNLARVLQGVPSPWTVAAMVGFTVPISGRLPLEKRLAAAEHIVELARVYDQEWTTRAAVRAGWAEWLAAVRRRDVLQDLVRQVDALLLVVEGIESAGELASLEAGLFRAEAAARAAALERALAAVQEQELALRRLMGLSPGAPVSLLTAEPPLDPVEIQDADEEAERLSPALAIARAGHEAAERRLELEVRKQYPDLQIGPGYEREGDLDKMLLSLSIPIPLLNRNQRGIAEATAQRQAARAEYEAAAEELASELRIAATRLAGATGQVRILQDRLIPQVDQQYAQARRVADLGEVNTFLLLETLTRLQDAKLSLIDARLAQRLAAIRLRTLIGPPQPIHHLPPEPQVAP